MSKDRANNRADREREAAMKQAAKGHEQDRQERPLSKKGSGEVLGKHGGPAITQPQHHHKPPKAGGARGKNPPKAGSPGKGKPTPKQSGPRTPVEKKRPQARTGRPDGPLARRRRFRIRLLVGLLLLVNIAVGVAVAVTDLTWAVSLAVLIGSFVLAPLLAAILLRRKK